MRFLYATFTLMRLKYYITHGYVMTCYPDKWKRDIQKMEITKIGTGEARSSQNRAGSCPRLANGSSRGMTRDAGHPIKFNTLKCPN